MAAVAFTTRNAAGLERYLAAHGIKAEMPLKAGEFGVHDPERQPGDFRAERIQ